MDTELASVILELRFTSSANLIQIKDVRPEILKKITGEKPPEPPKQQISGGLSFNNQRQMLRVVIEPSRIALSVENKNVKEAISIIQNCLKTTYQNTDYQSLKIQRIGARSVWLNQFNSSFTSLLEIYKKKFYQNNPLVSESKDVAVCLTLESSGSRVNFITAPINKKQLEKQILRFERNLNHDYAIADIDVISENLENIERVIAEFLKESISYGEKKAQETFNYIFNS